MSFLPSFQELRDLGGELVAHAVDLRELLHRGLPQFLDTAEAGQQGRLPLGPEAGHLVEPRLAELLAAQLGVEGVGEAMGLVADAHQQREADVVARQLQLAALGEDDGLLALGQADERRRGEAVLLERREGRADLAEAASDERLDGELPAPVHRHALPDRGDRQEHCRADDEHPGGERDLAAGGPPTQAAKPFSVIANKQRMEIGVVIRNVKEIRKKESRDAMLAFAKASVFFKTEPEPEPGIHPSAFVHPSARLGGGVYVGAHAIIEDEAMIENDVVIHDGVRIGARVQIGAGSVLFPGVVLFLTILAFNFLGDGLRDALDPQASKLRD